MKLGSQLVLAVGAVPRSSPVDRPDRPSGIDPRDFVEQCAYYGDWSSDYQNAYFNDNVCQRECSLRPVGDGAIEPYIYGRTNQIYKVYGTEKLGKKKVKKSYRAVIQIEESEHCNDDSLKKLRELFGSNPSSESSSIQRGIRTDKQLYCHFKS